MMNAMKSEIEMLRATTLELKAKVDNSGAPSSPTVQPTTSSAGYKRQREGDEESADHAKDKGAMFSEDQKRERDIMKERVNLMGVVVQRIVPREDFRGWNQRMVLKTLSGALESRTKRIRLLSFMDKCNTKHWHCLNCILVGKHDTAVGPLDANKEFDRTAVGCCLGCKDRVSLARVDTDGGPGSRYYYARYK
jgi:hypothetical protein